MIHMNSIVLDDVEYQNAQKLYERLSKTFKPYTLHLVWFNSSKATFVLREGFKLIAEGVVSNGRESITKTFGNTIII